MHRFFIPPESWQARDPALTGREAHHAVQVLRVRRGDEVLVLDGVGYEYRCAVQSTDRKRVALCLVEERSVPGLPWRMTLLQALPKGKLFETIIQKATELEVSRIVPLISERVIGHRDDDKEAKLERWQLVAVEAIKQSGSPWLPRIEAPVTPQEFLARDEKFDLALLCSLMPDRRHPRAYFDAYQHGHGSRPESLAVWIGPEGDFSPAEVNLIRAAGAEPISLGRAVLRTDTATVSCLSVLNYELSS